MKDKDKPRTIEGSERLGISLVVFSLPSIKISVNRREFKGWRNVEGDGRPVVCGGRVQVAARLSTP